jgi:hypothetical protein
MLALRQDSPPLPQLAARLAIPLATFAALRCYSALEPGASGAPEGAFLALFAAALLLTVAAFAVSPALELGAGALIATTAVWSLPPGPARGTALTVTLAATFVVAASRRLRVAVRKGELPFDLAVALALGAQILLRGHLLFAPERTPKTLFALLGLPVIGAGALWLLAKRYGVAQTVCAAALSLTLAPGWNVSSTLGWAGLAAGEALVRKDGPRALRGAALLAALGVVIRAPGLGFASLICGAALALPLPALGAALVTALFLRGPFDPSSLAAAAPQALWALLLVPSLILPARGRWPAALAALLLTIAIPLTPNAGVLAAPIALAALAASSRASIAVPRFVWSGALFLVSALLASYPWLRSLPLPAALRLVGLTPHWFSFLPLAGAVLGLAAIGFWMTREAQERAGWRFAGAALGLVFLAAGLGLTRPGQALLTPEIPVLLEAGQPRWSKPLSGASPRRVTVESSLSNAAGLSRGTPIATVRLFDEGGGHRDWTLRAGIDSGEWAARRPDVLLGAVLESPGPWVSWIADGFLAQRYRSRTELPRGGRAARIEIERAPALPADVTLAIHQLEIEP